MRQPTRRGDQGDRVAKGYATSGIFDQSMAAFVHQRGPKQVIAKIAVPTRVLQRGDQRPVPIYPHHTVSPGAQRVGLESAFVLDPDLIDDTADDVLDLQRQPLDRFPDLGCPLLRAIRTDRRDINPKVELLRCPGRVCQPQSAVRL